MCVNYYYYYYYREGKENEQIYTYIFKKQYKQTSSRAAHYLEMREWRENGILAHLRRDWSAIDLGTYFRTHTWMH